MKFRRNKNSENSDNIPVLDELITADTYMPGKPKPPRNLLPKIINNYQLLEQRLEQIMSERLDAFALVTKNKLRNIIITTLRAELYPNKGRLETNDRDSYDA